MSEEAEVQNVQEEESQGVDPTEPRAENETEAKAREQGWRPYEEWEGDEQDWVDAKEFVLRGELMDRIKKQSRYINSMKSEMDELKDSLQTLAQHHRKTAEVERKKAMDELKAAKKAAYEDNDFDAIVDIDERMGELKAVDLDEGPSEPEKPKESGPSPEVEEWLADNQWYRKDPVLQSVMNGVVQQLVADDPDLENDPLELLEKAKKATQKEMPHKFGKKKPEPSAVQEPGSSAPRKQRGKKFSSSQLNDVQKKIGKTFVDAGAVESLDEYAQQLGEQGEI